MPSRYLYPVIVGLLVLFGGVFVGTRVAVYEAVPYFDSILHAAGGFTVTWFFSVFYKNYLPSMSRIRRYGILLGTTAFVGVVWEIAEFISSKFSPGRSDLLYTYFHGGNLTDTMADLVFDLL